MSRRIEIVEVGPRDGLQNEKTLFEIEQKLEMIHRLEAAGARRMEVVSFVNPKRVPQMAGAEEIMAALPHKEGRSRIGLVLNMRGWERCLDAGCDGYIQKPIDIDRLPEQVANFITRSRHAH